MKNLLFLLSIFLALPVFAADANWYKNSACSQVVTSPNLIAGGNTDNARDLLYNCFGSGTGDTSLFTASNYFKMCFDTDSTNTATGSARIFLRQCLSNTKSTNSCERVHVDRDGNGVIDTGSLDGTVGTVQNRCTYDLPPGFYYIEFSVARTSSENPIVQVQVQK